MNPVTTTTAVPTQVSTETPVPVRASSPTTTSTTTPSPPTDTIPSTNPATTAPTLTPAPAVPSQEATALLLKTTNKTNTNTDPAPTMGHKTRKGVLYTTAFFVPPLAVYLKHGTNKHFGLNVLLTLLGWIPGVLHAMYHVSK